MNLKELCENIIVSMTDASEDIANMMIEFQEASQEGLKDNFQMDNDSKDSVVEKILKTKEVIDAQFEVLISTLRERSANGNIENDDELEPSVDLDSEVDETAEIDSDIEGMEIDLTVEGVEEINHTKKKVETSEVSKGAEVEEPKIVVTEGEEERMEESEEYDIEGVENYSAVIEISENLTDLAEGLDNERLTESEMVDDEAEAEETVELYEGLEMDLW